jgi:hypothetical protein
MQDEIDKVVDQYIELLPIEDDKLLAHSEVKASQFLLAIAKLASIRDKLMNQKVKKDALKSVEYANAINHAPGTNAPTKQANAEANPNYLEIAKEVALIDNQLSYTKTMVDVFTNAHLLYRNLMKGEL